MQSKSRITDADQTASGHEVQNLGKAERIISTIGGAGLIAYGIKNRSKIAKALSLAAGGFLMYRGATGHSHLYKALRVGTAPKATPETSVAEETGIRIDETIIIDRPVSEVYRYWRNLENLPQIMRHLETVRMLDNRNSYWKVKGPAGINIEWYAEIINDLPNERIGWKSIDSAIVDNAGSVHFQAINENRTQIDVTLKYAPPAGKIGNTFAKLFGEDPKSQIAEDLGSLKSLMESQELASTTEPFGG
jgi:uncharacterized membrane protein